MIIPSVGKDAEQLEFPFTAGLKDRWHSHLGSVGQQCQMLNINIFFELFPSQVHGYRDESYMYHETFLEQS